MINPTTEANKRLSCNFLYHKKTENATFFTLFQNKSRPRFRQLAQSLSDTLNIFHNPLADFLRPEFFTAIHLNFRSTHIGIQ